MSDGIVFWLLDTPRVEELHAEIKALAARMGFAVRVFSATEDRTGQSFPLIRIELDQGLVEWKGGDAR